MSCPVVSRMGGRLCVGIDGRSAFLRKVLGGGNHGGEEAVVNDVAGNENGMRRKNKKVGMKAGKERGRRDCDGCGQGPIL